MTIERIPEPRVPEITALELKERLDRSEDVALVDVRSPHEYTIADLPEVGQLRIPMQALPDRVDELDRFRDLIVYCRSGARSARVTAYLLANGFERVWNLKGGLLKWHDDVDPTIRTY